MIQLLFFSFFFFFFNDTATTEIYTLSLHDALPICFQMVPWEASLAAGWRHEPLGNDPRRLASRFPRRPGGDSGTVPVRAEPRGRARRRLRPNHRQGRILPGTPRGRGGPQRTDEEHARGPGAPAF